jgi:ABC-type dipeptide/oligopeptide/nickel transport system permease subunit
MGLAAMALSATVGITLGILGGYLGGRLDTVLMRVVDIMLAFPCILLAIVIVATLGPGLVNTMLAIGIAGIASGAARRFTSPSGRRCSSLSRHGPTPSQTPRMPSASP